MRSTEETWLSTVFTAMWQVEPDLLVGIAPGDQAEHLALAGGELVELGVEVGLARRAAGPLGEGVEDEPGEAGGEDGVSRRPPGGRASTSSGPETVFVR